MPILDPEYVATWWIFTDPTTGDLRLFESWDEKQIQEVDPKQLIQGDIGTHVMDVGGNWWETSISSPIVLVKTINNSNSTSVANVFDIIVNEFAIIQSPTLVTNANHLMESATITITEKEIKCDIRFLSDNSNIFEPQFGLSNVQDYIARLAKGFLDATFTVYDGSLNGTYQILTGTINIKININKKWFVNQGASPFFSVQGYGITGDITVLANPTAFQAANEGTGIIITPQPVGELDTSTSVSSTSLRIGNSTNGTTFNFGEAGLNSQVQRNMQSGNVTSIKIEFKTYVRATTNITG